MKEIPTWVRDSRPIAPKEPPTCASRPRVVTRTMSSSRNSTLLDISSRVTHFEAIDRDEENVHVEIKPPLVSSSHGASSGIKASGRTKWCSTDSGNVVLLDYAGGLSNSIGVSKLERDGVPSRDTDSGDPGNEFRRHGTIGLGLNYGCVGSKANLRGELRHIQGNRNGTRESNIERVKCSETSRVRSCTLCLDSAEEYRKANEDTDEDDISCRGAQGANEKYPRITLHTSC
ncbi:hypothetical protein BJY52DRAFT_1419504 [Lactarius psammicola]|nr:hypothetical protein BJY52DRAFT_1419504 [Lactarius psammicola]